VFVDASSSGNFADASLVESATATVQDNTNISVFSLPTPVVAKQGDIYIIFSDLSTDPDGTPLPIVFPADGGVSDPRTLVTTTPTSPADNKSGGFFASNLLPGVDPGSSLMGNAVVRGFGDLATATDLVTGDGQPVNEALSPPTNLTGVANGTGVLLNWTPPGLPVTNEQEPNNNPNSAQGIQLNSRILGTGNQNEDGADGGFAAAGSTEDIEDWFSFHTDTAGPISIALYGFGQTDFDLFLYPKAGPFEPDPDSGFASGNQGGVDEAITIDSLPPGDWVIGVDAYDGDGSDGNPGVPTDTNYTLDVIGGVGVSNFNIYCGVGDFTPGPDTFFGTAGGHATSFLVASSAPGSTYKVTAVYGDQQSTPTNGAQGGACEGGPSITQASLKLKKNGKLTLTGGPFTADDTVSINGAALPAGKVKKGGTVLKIKGPLTNGQPISSVVTSGQPFTIVVIGGGGCTMFTGTAP
jgi:hypothetical protein